MKNLIMQDFKVTEPVSLTQTPTFLDLKTSEKRKEKELQKVREKLSKIQDKMYAHNRYSVLICIQGMDTAGKDSLIREVFKEFNARGVVVHSFKKPSSTELEHDFLWRHYVALPEKGKFTVFNRSHYENVLISRVKPQILLSENIPGIENTENIPNDFWEHRMESILDFEKHLSRNGMIIMKFFLHLGKEEQKNRLMRRLEKAKHHWKFSPDDLTEREHWDTYLDHYEDLINRTSKPHAPWFVIPADNKETSRYMVAKTILDTMEKYTDIEEPALNENIQKNLEMYRSKLENS
jgi:PPK2 family polyphosphate:nucleotide phosphotransferase